MAPPGVGSKKIIHNTRERVLSGDHNREQAVHDQMLAEILRCLTDPSYELDVAGGVETNGTGSESLPRATIISGIRVRPEVGTINCFVEPGAICILDNPRPNADESKLAYVVDPGVQTAGVLTLTPGSGGSIRIDVVECQRVETIIETDSRDIFDPGTGLFSPTLVNKVTTGRLVYRIRLGTPGLGFPGIAAGWLPLAVCSVPAAAITWDSVTLWDVRPLYHERVVQPCNARNALNTVQRHNVWTDVTTVPGEIRVIGVVDVSFGVYKAGGQLIHPGTTDQWINATDATLAAAALAGANATWHIYLVFPFGLPRWVQYSPASASIREPRGQRGIPVIARWAARYDGLPLTNIAQTPAWTGLQDPASQNAVVAIAGLQDPFAVPAGIISDGRVVQLSEDVTLEINSSASSGSTSSTWTLSDNTTHPGNARAVYVQLRVTLNVTAGTPGTIEYSRSVLVGGPNNVATNFVNIANTGESTEYMYVDLIGTRVLSLTVRVPLAIEQTYLAIRQFKLLWVHVISGTTYTISTRTAVIKGWELGP